MLFFVSQNCICEFEHFQILCSHFPEGSRKSLDIGPVGARRALSRTYATDQSVSVTGTDEAWVIFPRDIHKRIGYSRISAPQVYRFEDPIVTRLLTNIEIA